MSRAAAVGRRIRYPAAGRDRDLVSVGRDEDVRRDPVGPDVVRLVALGSSSFAGRSSGACRTRVARDR